MKTFVILISAAALTVGASAQQQQPVPIGTDNNRGGVFNNVLRAITGEQDTSSATEPGTISLDQLTKNWNPAARQAAQRMFQKYGAPQEVSTDRLVWRNNGHWRTTQVINEDVQHHFPTPHNDVIEQSVPMNVPPEKIGELAQFSGSILVDRTKGEISARCDSEENNLIALNLANDIIRGRLDVEQARSRYTELAQAVQQGQRPKYSTGFQFSVASTDTGFLDTASAQPQQQPQQWQRIGW